MFKKIIFFLSFFIVSGINVSMAVAMEKPHHQQKSPLAVINVNDHKIYTAQIKLQSGEIAYLGFEPIINENRHEKWGTYRILTEALTSERSFLYAIFKRTDVLYDNPTEFDKWIGRVFPKTTNHKQEVQNLVKKISKENAARMAEAIKGIGSGTLGLHTSIGCYVAYISKEPITGFFPLPDESPDLKDFDAYIDAYNNLIMVVSSFDLEEEGKKSYFEHRGIFRNPISMLRKDYQGVGLLIHEFAAYAKSEAFLEKKFMRVNPDGNIKMADLLVNSFTSEEIHHNGNHYIIKLEALKKKFLEANITKDIK